MKYALLSVFDKHGIVELAKNLSDLGYKIISTGGTAKALTDANISVIPIQDITGNPESFDGRMKTISFQIESGILFDRTNPSHVKQAENLGIKPIDIVICNLYPFEQTIAKKAVRLEEAVENIDVGGPTMIRAAAKNFKNVLVIVDPKDYSKVSTLLHSNRLSQEKRKELAAKAFAHLSFYDSQIARFLKKEFFPEEITIPGRKKIALRYGENPHQQATLYFLPNTNSPLQNLTQKWGRGLSFVNVTDIYSGLEVVRLFKEPAAAVIKHNSPCGIALGSSPKEALKRAIEADPESAFGGVIVLNKAMEKNAAEIIGNFRDERAANIDIVAVPTIAKDALLYLQNVRKSMGIYTFGKIPKVRSHTQHLKWIDGGFLLQTEDHDSFDTKNWTAVTKKKPSAKQISQMKIAWKFIMRIRSNAVIVVDKTIPMTRGIGSGQTSRVRSTQIALQQAGNFAKGAILASDSFFPFDDSVKLAAKAEVAAIVQQGGSVNDKLSIEAANKAGITMVFTHRRAFWH